MPRTAKKCTKTSGKHKAEENEISSFNIGMVSDLMEISPLETPLTPRKKKRRGLPEDRLKMGNGSGSSDSAKRKLSTPTKVSPSPVFVNDCKNTQSSPPGPCKPKVQKVDNVNVGSKEEDSSDEEETPSCHSSSRRLLFSDEQARANGTEETEDEVAMVVPADPAQLMTNESTVKPTEEQTKPPILRHFLSVFLSDHQESAEEVVLKTIDVVGMARPQVSQCQTEVAQSQTDVILNDIQIDFFLHYGSDKDEDSDEDDEGGTVMTVVPRTSRIYWDTPEDEEEPPVHEFAEFVPEHFIPEELVAVTEDPEIVPVATSAANSTNFEFDWQDFPVPPIPPENRRERFMEKSGPKVTLSDPYELFISIWDSNIMRKIADETNLYAQQLAAEMMHTGTLQPNSRISEWKDTTPDELFVYLAIVLAMGVVVKSRIEEYWIGEADIFSTPGFSGKMSLRRFQLLGKCLHFNNSTLMAGLNLTPSEAKLYKIQPIIDHINTKFETMYTLGRNIALDESLLQWKGWLDINQFIPHKAAAVGIKSYEICESQTGYLWRFQIHSHISPATHNDPDPLATGVPALVLNLVHGLEHKGHTLWMDNYYNSPLLARKLKSLNFDCVGTLRTNRKYVPKGFTTLSKANMRPGDITGCTSGDVDLLVWRDQNRVALISTYHGNCVSTINGKKKPTLILDYNICMGGVDKKDQMLATYPIERKRNRVWYKKLFRRLLNASVLNAYIIQKQTTQTPLSHRQFRQTLIRSLLTYHSHDADPRHSATLHNKHHYPAQYPKLTTPGSNNRQRHRCKVCKKSTVSYCVGCENAVCVFSCFPALHNW